VVAAAVVVGVAPEKETVPLPAVFKGAKRDTTAANFGAEQ
jgi:hypothetical protein